METTNQQQQAEVNAELAAQIQVASRDELIGLIHTYRAEYAACKKQLDEVSKHVSAQAATIRQQESELQEAEDVLDEYDSRLDAREAEIAKLKTQNRAILEQMKELAQMSEKLKERLVQANEKLKERAGQSSVVDTAPARSNPEQTTCGAENAPEDPQPQANAPEKPSVTIEQRRQELYKRTQEHAAETEKRMRAEIEEREAKVKQWQNSVEAQQEHIFRLEARSVELKIAVKEYRAERKAQQDAIDRQGELHETVKEVREQPTEELQRVKDQLKKTRNQVRATIKEVRAQKKMCDEAKVKLERHIQRTNRARELYAEEQASRTK